MKNKGSQPQKSNETLKDKISKDLQKQIKEHKTDIDKLLENVDENMSNSLSSNAEEFLKSIKQPGGE